MADVTEDRETPRQDGVLLAHGVKAAHNIYRGILVNIDATTRLAESATNAASKSFGGVSYERCDNSAGAAGAKKVRLYRKGIHTFGYTGTAPGENVQLYVSDNQTVTATAGATPVPCGKSAWVDTTTQTVGVDIDR